MEGSLLEIEILGFRPGLDPPGGKLLGVGGGKAGGPGSIEGKGSLAGPEGFGRPPGKLVNGWMLGGTGKFDIDCEFLGGTLPGSGRGPGGGKDVGNGRFPVGLPGFGIGRKFPVGLPGNGIGRKFPVGLPGNGIGRRFPVLLPGCGRLLSGTCI